MTLNDMTDQFELQGKIVVMVWDGERNNCIERREFDGHVYGDIAQKEILYMYPSVRNNEPEIIIEVTA